MVALYEALSYLIDVNSVALTCSLEIWCLRPTTTCTWNGGLTLCSTANLSYLFPTVLYFKSVGCLLLLPEEKNCLGKITSKEAPEGMRNNLPPIMTKS